MALRSSWGLGSESGRGRGGAEKKRPSEFEEEEYWGEGRGEMVGEGERVAFILRDFLRLDFSFC